MSKAAKMDNVFANYAANNAIENNISNTSSREDFKNGDLVIAVLDRGWVFVGFVTVLDNERVRLDCCHNIHRWGTSAGLGEIAIKGPLQETILYPCEVVYGKPVFIMKASDKWFT